MRRMMNADHRPVIVIGLLMLLLAAMMSLAWKAYQSPPSPTAVKWEYHIASAPDPLVEDMMNKLGAEGWEVISARRATANVGSNVTGQYEIIFRRQILPTNPPLILTHPRF